MSLDVLNLTWNKYIKFTSSSLFARKWLLTDMHIILLLGRDLGRNWPQTREIAADRVVLPWSTWPMVPMFTWGCKRDKLQKQEHYNRPWAQLGQTSTQVVFDTTVDLGFGMADHCWGPWLAHLSASQAWTALRADKHVTKHHCQAVAKLQALRPLRLNPAAWYKPCKEVRRL